MNDNQSLPLIWLLSDARNDGSLEEILSRLPERSGFVFRHYHLNPSERRARFENLALHARRYGHLVVLSGNHDWGADGTYAPPGQAGPGINLATAHNAEELQEANAEGAHGVFLSPVYPTASHPGAKTLGVDGFHRLARRSKVPVIALGGMTEERAKVLDWPRWGAIDGLLLPKSA